MGWSHQLHSDDASSDHDELARNLAERESPGGRDDGVLIHLENRERTEREPLERENRQRENRQREREPSERENRQRERTVRERTVRERENR